MNLCVCVCCALVLWSYPPLGAMKVPCFSQGHIYLGMISNLLIGPVASLQYVKAIGWDSCCSAEEVSVTFSRSCRSCLVRASLEHMVCWGATMVHTHLPSVSWAELYTCHVSSRVEGKTWESGIRGWGGVGLWGYGGKVEGTGRVKLCRTFQAHLPFWGLHINFHLDFRQVLKGILKTGLVSPQPLYKLYAWVCFIYDIMDEIDQDLVFSFSLSIL